MIVEDWIGLDQPERWNAALETIPHGYWHGWNACRAASDNAGWPAFLYMAQDASTRVACPLMQREWRGARDFTTPTGISGFAASTEVLPEWFPGRWTSFLRGKGGSSVYLAQHPLYAPSWPGGEETPANTLFLIDLDVSPREWLELVDENRRRGIRSWEKAGCPWVLDRPELVRFLVANHNACMHAMDASAGSFFSDEALRLLCADPLVELVGASDELGVCTVAVFGSTRWGCELLLNISVREGRVHTAALMWWAVQHYHARVPVLSLGGTPSDDGPLAAAKRRYRPRELRFRKLKLVLDPAAYEKHCAEARVAPDDISGYFPPYMQPRSE